MGRTKRPPIVHIPYPTVTGIANPQPQTEKTQVPLSKDLSKISTEMTSDLISSPSTSFEKETPAPVGVTECPHCNVDFSNMAITDVRDHVESCSRPTTAGSESDTSELSDPPESPKLSADQLDGNEDQESDLESLSDIEGFEEGDLEDLPGPYDDNDEEDSKSPNEESAPEIKFPKLKKTSEILGSLDDIENMSDFELNRRAANVASILDTYQKEWMALERKTAKAAISDGVPVLRNPRVVRENISYQDRLEADVYGYVHNPHPTLLGKQDPIGQRQGSGGDGELRSRLRKQTKKAVDSYTDTLAEEGRPVRTRNTPTRFETESREQTPAGARKPRGRGKGGRVDELRSEYDTRPVGARTGSPLAQGSTSEHGLQSLSSLKDRALASTEADEDSTANSRPTSSSSSQSAEADDSAPKKSSKPGKKRRHSPEIGESSAAPAKKARVKSNTATVADTSTDGKKPRAKQMVVDDKGVLRSRQSVMMEKRWASFKANPNGARIGRQKKSQTREKDTDSEVRSSRKRSLGETNDQADATGGGKPKKRKTTKDDQAGEENGADRSEQGSQAPVKGKRGGRREGSGRKPAKGSSYKGKRQSQTTAERAVSQLDGVEDGNDGAAQTPVRDEEPFEPSSGSTRASTRFRRPSAAKQEADDGMSSVYSHPAAKKARGSWGGKREKGKRSDGSLIKQSTSESRASASLQEGSMGADTDQSEGDTPQADNEDDMSGSQKKSAKKRKGSSAADDYPDLPVYDRTNPSQEYQDLPKNLKMKAVSRARWRNGGMGHMFGQKGPNKIGQKKLATTQSDTNSAGTSKSVTPSAPSTAPRTKPLFKPRNYGHDGSDERDMDSPSTAPPTKLKRKISEYEEFQALSSSALHSEGGEEKKRGKRGAAMRASHSFIEPSTSSDFEEDEEEEQVRGDDGGDYGATQSGNGVRKSGGTGMMGVGRKGVGGRPPRPTIQTDVANAAAGLMSRSGSGSGMTTNTLYDTFQALSGSAPGTPIQLGKRIRKPVLRGGDMDTEEEEYEYAE